jgi:hypothetical protein
MGSEYLRLNEVAGSRKGLVCDCELEPAILSCVEHLCAKT